MTGSAVITPDSFLIYPNDVVDVVVADPVAVSVQAGPAAPVAVVVVTGPVGPPGAPGPTGAGADFLTAVLPDVDQDGENATFALPSEARFPNQVQVFRNGLMELPGLSFNATSTHITFTSPPLDSDAIVVFYEV